MEIWQWIFLGVAFPVYGLVAQYMYFATHIFFEVMKAPVDSGGFNQVIRNLNNIKDISIRIPLCRRDEVLCGLAGMFWPGTVIICITALLGSCGANSLLRRVLRW